MELRGTTKLRSLQADNQDESALPLNPAFNFRGVFKSLKPTSWARADPSKKCLAEWNYTRLRYALTIGRLAPGERFRLAKVARRTGTNITPARHARWQFATCNAAHANRRSGIVVRMLRPTEFGKVQKGRLALEGWPLSISVSLHPVSDCGGFKILPVVWVFRLDIPKLPQWDFPALHVCRICSCIGPIIPAMAAAIGRLRCITRFLEEAIVDCRNLIQACNYMCHELATGMTSSFRTATGEQSLPLYSCRLLSSHPERVRNTVDPETAMVRWSRARDGVNWNDVWPLVNRLRQRQEHVCLMRAPLYASSAALNIAIAAV